MKGVNSKINNAIECSDGRFVETYRFVPSFGCAFQLELQKKHKRGKELKAFKFEHIRAIFNVICIQCVDGALFHIVINKGVRFPTIFGELTDT